MSRPVRLATVLFALCALTGTSLAASACSSPGEAAMPDRMPDVLGHPLDEAVTDLRDQGFSEILLFTEEVHAADTGEADLDGDLPVTMSEPGPDEDAVAVVHLWVGERPAVPADVPSDAWYYPHRERIEARGTDICLGCHERASCSVCHEDRLEETAALLRSDPEDAPDLAAATAAAVGMDERDVTALNQGGGWFRVELEAGGGGSREVASRARRTGVEAFPAAFDAEPAATTILLAWLEGDTPMVEIGFERSTYAAYEWDDLTADDLPWIADRYAVPSD